MAHVLVAPLADVLSAVVAQQPVHQTLLARTHGHRQHGDDLGAQLQRIDVLQLGRHLLMDFLHRLIVLPHKLERFRDRRHRRGRSPDQVRHGLQRWAVQLRIRLLEPLDQHV
uniref:Putative secreted protein n=1 Tax=Anopheles triannulatus TaxID=58253 RepID=A0A2M4B1C2_9DIPT